MKYIDTESKPIPREDILEMAPEFSAPSNWKDEDKIAAKIREQEDKFIDKAALNPATATVMAIGFYDDETEQYQGLVADTESQEANILTDAWGLIADHDAYTVPVLGWNTLGFDLPFMVKRSWKLGVKVPRTTLESYKGRISFNAQFQDMMKVWAFGEYNSYTKLEDVLRFFGLAPKVDLGDELFYQTYAKDPAKAMEYLKRDVMGMVELSNYIKI